MHLAAVKRGDAISITAQNICLGLVHGVYGAMLMGRDEI